MAKATAKSATAPVKKASATAKPKAKASSSAEAIEKVSKEILKTFQAVGIEEQLQADLTWCLGSYAHDKNPIGLYEIGEQSLIILKREQAKKTKGVTAKLINDLEKVLSTK